MKSGPWSRLLLVSAMACIAMCANAASLTTTYAGGNTNSVGGVVYFDLNVLASGGLTVTGIETNVLGGAERDLSLAIYTRPGSYAGFESSEGWTLVATGTAFGAAFGDPTIFTLSNSFTLGPGTTGFAIHNVDYSAAYTNGTTTYSNSDLQLIPGVAQNVLFSGFVNSPRIWNGTIVYDVADVPEPSSWALLATGIGVIALRVRRRA
jgi:hypothetical protein